MLEVCYRDPSDKTRGRARGLHFACPLSSRYFCFVCFSALDLFALCQKLALPFVVQGCFFYFGFEAKKECVRGQALCVGVCACVFDSLQTAAIFFLIEIILF